MKHTEFNPIDTIQTIIKAGQYQNLYLRNFIVNVGLSGMAENYKAGSWRIFQRLYPEQCYLPILKHHIKEQNICQIFLF